ncbi:MAG: hypothetical protein AB8B82_12215 [Roseovarius sp.]
MMFIIENQLALLILFFATGCVGTGVLLRRRAGHRAWLMADLTWVVLGGFGALVAVLAGVYKADSGQINRQIDVAFSASSAFDRDAARFRLSYCEGAQGVHVAVLCDKVDFLSASTAQNADLPLFIAITSEVSPLRSLNFFGRKAEADMEMVSKADAFDPDQFLIFASRDENTSDALRVLRVSQPFVAADFNILASSYDALVTQVGKLKDEWEYLQSNAFILIVQIIAICMVSFAAPFRLGKSIVDLRDR